MRFENCCDTFAKREVGEADDGRGDAGFDRAIASALRADALEEFGFAHRLH